MNENEAVLLRRFTRTGDAEAFAAITRLYAGMVYGVCLRVTRDAEHARDATQDTFFQLLKSAGKVTGSLGGWLVYQYAHPSAPPASAPLGGMGFGGTRAAADGWVPFGGPGSNGQPQRFGGMMMRGAGPSPMRTPRGVLTRFTANVFQGGPVRAAD